MSISKYKTAIIKTIKTTKKKIYFFIIKLKLKQKKNISLKEQKNLLETLWKKSKVNCYLVKSRKYVNDKDLSIIIPIYNSEIFLDNLLTRLINQETNYNYEVILVNDGSTDNSSKIIRDYQKNHKNLFNVIEKKNGGISDARNAGLEIARGKYISFLDSDDYINERYVETLLSIAFKQQADIVKCGTANIKNGLIVSKDQKPKKTISGKMGFEILCYPSYPWGGVFKSDLLKNIQFPKGYWYEDMIIRFFLYRASTKFINIPDILHYRTQHSNQITKKFDSEKGNKPIEQLYLIEQLVEDNAKSNLGEDVNLYLNVLLECSTVMVNRINNLDDVAKKQVFIRVHKLISKLHKPEYDKLLDSQWKLKSDIILQNRYDLWLLEKNL